MLIPNTNIRNCNNYNFKYSSNYMYIECPFGILINNWLILWYPLNAKFKYHIPLTNTYFYLCSFCINRKILKKDHLKSRNKHI